jgi:hypothetical protein
MKTKPKTFDAVAASRKWREDTGRMLDAMSVPERIAYLEGLRKRFEMGADAGASCLVREDPAPYGGKAGT